MTVDELMGVKTNRTIQIELTEEERHILFATVDACEHQLTVSDVTTLRQTFHYLKQHLKVLFSRAQPQ
jgi:hypothetical protein